MKLRILNAGKTLPSKNNNVQRRQIALLPKCFPYQSLDAIALYSKFQVFL